MDEPGGLEWVDLAHREHDELLRAFYEGIYLEAFAHQREPVDTWRRLLWGGGPQPLEHHVLVVGTDLDGDARVISGGIVFEYYPRSACALATYLVVAPGSRRKGLGRALIERAIETTRGSARAHGVTLAAVFAEASDPRLYPPDCADEAWARVERFQRWGARVAEFPYVQPDLGAGLGRDDALVLLVFEPRAPVDVLPPGVLARFLSEFYEVTEGVAEPDRQTSDMLKRARGDVRLRVLARGNDDETQ